ncbi:STAS domain-containing protein [Pseudomonas weihenstephanensis]|uniref:Anti-anti-sigma factor n=1 Tax=Pseudomonas weihenstephanensis TaxID=1608994 RepID=A0A0J6IQS6_9PSED|nr:STAS domain-containing protein [Pseudomonas weihenstephanensis]KMN11851.1 anti-anti-sigma factor [Pseudomonas weihenstephanensis]KMN16780.1 anti-anti-sigma factor [Pseudomonas weihenstephanensis]MBM1193386.1 STAS domain-containing protein [Pseudomonas weihenstephanensis]GLX91530.1 STAS domain-containing protein [Pseudomonas fragi]
MAVTSELSPEGTALTLSIKGRFDFAKHQDFRGAYEKPMTKPELFVVDLKETTYVDSSALGMLLLLREYAGGDESDVRVVNCNSDVRKILAISNFDKLFDIS